MNKTRAAAPLASRCRVPTTVVRRVPRAPLAGLSRRRQPLLFGELRAPRPGRSLPVPAIVVREIRPSRGCDFWMAQRQRAPHDGASPPPRPPTALGAHSLSRRSARRGPPCSEASPAVRDRRRLGQPVAELARGQHGCNRVADGGEVAIAGDQVVGLGDARERDEVVVVGIGREPGATGGSSMIVAASVSPWTYAATVAVLTQRAETSAWPTRRATRRVAAGWRRGQRIPASRP